MRVWIAAIALVIGFALALWARSKWTTITRARRLRRAFDGERRAEHILERDGYRVIARQAKSTVQYAIDGEPLTAEVRADLLVERGGRTFVAEVKTGERARSLHTPATRRQLLEYGLAFDAHGVLLVDADDERVHRVALPSRSHPRSIVMPFVIGLAVGAAIAFSVLRAIE